MNVVRKFKSWVELLGAVLLVLAPVLAVSALPLSLIYTRFNNAGALTGAVGAYMFFALLVIACLCVVIGGTLFLVSPALQRWPNAPAALVAALGGSFLVLGEALHRVSQSNAGDTAALVLVLLGLYSFPLGAIAALRQRQLRARIH
jgi:hypothetical protein